MMKLTFYAMIMAASLLAFIPNIASGQSVSQKYVKEQEAAKKKQADLVKQSTQKKKN